MTKTDATVTTATTAPLRTLAAWLWREIETYQKRGQEPGCGAAYREWCQGRVAACEAALKQMEEMEA